MSQDKLGPLNRLAALLFLIVFSSLVALAAINRQYFGYGTETDYLALFIQEAQRFSNGEPLLILFHPPLYSITLAVTSLFFSDWLTIGLIVSLLSTIVVLIGSFYFFARLFGTWAAWGSWAGLAGSVVFLVSAASATSDMFFLALIFASYALVLGAIESNAARTWSLCGLLLGCILLTRSNGLSFILLAAAPWLGQVTLKRRAVNFAAMAGGFIVPLLAWGVYAASSGAPFLPGANYLNLAATYFPADDLAVGGERLAGLENRFSSIGDVFLHDPVRMAKIYLAELKALVFWGMPDLMSFPLSHLFLPGLFLLLVRSFSPIFLLFILVTAAQIALVNFKSFEARFFLFLVPFLGAGLGEMSRLIVGTARPAAIKAGAAVILFIGAAGAGVNSYSDANSALHSSATELNEAIPAVQQFVPNGAVIVSRNPHMAFYAENATLAYIPTSLAARNLRAFLAKQSAIGPVYLYYGQKEKTFRPQFASLLTSNSPPDWLELLATGNPDSPWFLYRYTE